MVHTAGHIQLLDLEFNKSFDIYENTAEAFFSFLIKIIEVKEVQENNAC